MKEEMKDYLTSSIPLLSLNTTHDQVDGISRSNAFSLVGQCKWTSLNFLLAGFLGLTLVVNLAAAVVILRVPMTTKRGTLNPVYLCIRALNAIDILQALLLLVTPFFSNTDCVWWGGIACCKAMGFLALLFVMASPLITVIMAIDRTVAIYSPIEYRNFLGIKVLKVLLPLFGFFTLVLIFPPLFGVGEYHVVRGRRLCLLDTITEDLVDRAFVLSVHSFYLVFLVFMMVCTVAFERKVISLFMKKKKTSALRRRANTATVTTMAVCFTFISCYTPFVIRVLYEATTMKKSPNLVTWFTFSLALLQPLLNPIVCLATNIRYRSELKVMFWRMKRGDRRWLTDSMTATSDKHYIQGSQKYSPTRSFNRRRLNSSATSRVTSPEPTDAKRRTFSFRAITEQQRTATDAVKISWNQTNTTQKSVSDCHRRTLNLTKSLPLDDALEPNVQDYEKEMSDSSLNHVAEEYEKPDVVSDLKKTFLGDKNKCIDDDKHESIETDQGIGPDLQIDFHPIRSESEQDLSVSSSPKSEKRDSGVDVRNGP